MISGALYLLGFLFFFNGTFFYLWRVKDIKALLLGLVLVCFGLMSFYNGLLVSKDILNIPGILGINILLHSITHVLFFYILQIYMNNEFKWNKRYYFFGLYPLFQLVFYLPHVFKSPAAKITIANEILSRQILFFNSVWSKYLHFLGVIWIILVCFIVILKRFHWKKVSLANKRKRMITKYVFVAFIVLIILLVSRILYNVNDDQKVIPEFRLIYYSVFFVFGLYFQLAPYHYKFGLIYFDVKTFKPEKVYGDYLNSKVIHRIEKKLFKVINKDKIHRDDSITLGKMAEALNVSQHQLSAFLNLQLKTNFPEFLNIKRIQDAKMILIEEKQKNILEVCYEIGYNSPSAFYKAFKKEEGMSPKKWLEKNKS